MCFHPHNLSSLLCLPLLTPSEGERGAGTDGGGSAWGPRNQVLPLSPRATPAPSRQSVGKKPGLRDINTENTIFYECLRCLFPKLTTINLFTALSFIAFSHGTPTCWLPLDPVQLLITERLAWQLAQATTASWQLGECRQESPGAIF